MSEKKTKRIKPTTTKKQRQKSLSPKPDVPGIRRVPDMDSPKECAGKLKKNIKKRNFNQTEGNE